MSYTQQTIDYDKNFDVFYCKIANTDNSYGDEIDSNIVVLRDIETDTVTGITIMGYKKFVKQNIQKINIISKYVNAEFLKKNNIVYN